jgi:predicted SprT family Zn-dependent metalloprotease
MNTSLIKIPTPTKQQFEAFENAYQYFNVVLFAKQLPPVLLNLSRKSKAMGFVAPFRWRAADTDGKDKKSRIHELSINPEILCMNLIEVYSTLVHEQCHIWQHTHGKPSRPGYHNKEFAEKMIEVGLQPSTTGAPGGAIVGQSMSDYPIDGGRFLVALENMPHDFKLPFISIEGDRRISNVVGMNAHEGHSTEGTAPADGGQSKKNKIKYSCPGCQANIWGKPDLNVICGNCHELFQEQ